MIQPSTEDQIRSWTANKYGATAAPSLSAATQPAVATAAPTGTGMLGATATPTGISNPAAPKAATTPTGTWATAAAPAAPAPAPAAAPATPTTFPTSAATAPAPKAVTPNVSNWYKNELGRTGDSAGISYWQQQLDNGIDPEKLYGEFTKAATSNGDSDKGATWATVNTDPAVAQIYRNDITTRSIDPATETVQGQLGGLLAENSPVLQQARADAQRQAAGRGMLNSAMAASGGEDALIRSASAIATTDAGAFNNAANYNAAAQNQALLANVQAQNTQSLQTQSLDATATQQDKSLASQQALAQMQDATTRYNAELSANTSRYNTDTAYKQQMDSQKQSLANNIIANMEWSPDRKASMLEALGLGTIAKYNMDGSYSPGTGLAGAVYVIGSTSADLNPSSNVSEGPVYPGADGRVGSALNEGAMQKRDQEQAVQDAADRAAEREDWGRGVVTSPYDVAAS